MKQSDMPLDGNTKGFMKAELKTRLLCEKTLLRMKDSLGRRKPTHLKIIDSLILTNRMKVI